MSSMRATAQTKVKRNKGKIYLRTEVEDASAPARKTRAERRATVSRMMTSAVVVHRSRLPLERQEVRIMIANILNQRVGKDSWNP